MGKLKIVLVLLVLLISVNVTAYAAENDITINKNNMGIKYTNQQPIEKDGCAYANMNGKLWKLVSGTANNSAAATESSIKIIVNDKEIKYKGQQPLKKDGGILVPLNGVFEKLVPATASKDEIFKVTWNKKTSTATIKNKWYQVIIKPGKKTFTSNGKTFTPAVKPQLIDKKLMIPLYDVAEAVDATADWNEEKQTMKVYYEAQIKVN